MELTTTADAPIQRCRMCGKPEHGSLACAVATDWTVNAPTPPVGNIVYRPTRFPHKCPICDGCGTVPADFYTRMGVATGTLREKCRPCCGSGVVWSDA